MALFHAIFWLEKRLTACEGAAAKKIAEITDAYETGLADGWLERQEQFWSQEKQRRAKNGQFKSLKPKQPCPTQTQFN